MAAQSCVLARSRGLGRPTTMPLPTSRNWEVDRQGERGFVLSRYPVALAVTVLALGIAGHRLWFIVRLVRSGTPAPANWRQLGRRGWVEVREVIGQQRLLRWTVPGLAHAFTFWGFLILVFTIVETYGNLFTQRFAIAGIGHAAVLGFLEDVFSLGVLIAVAVFVILRLRESPRRLERSSRFFGSHLATAWIVLGMIVAVVLTLLVYRGAQTNTGDFPYGWWAFASHGIGRALAPLGRSGNRTVATVFIDLNVVVISAFLALVVLHQAPAHLPRTGERRFLAPAERARTTRDDTQHGPRRGERGQRLRRGSDRELQLEAAARLRDLHRVRAVPKPVSCVGDGQAPVTQARRDGSPRRALRAGAPIASWGG